MEHSAKTILVTGGSGFLGAHVVDALIAEGGFHVIAISRNPPTYHNPKAQYIACDITNFSEIAAIVEQIKPIAIVHTITPGPFASPLLHDQDYAATKNLVELASECAFVKTFVYSGSAESFSNVSGAYAQPLTEKKAIWHTSKTAPSAYAKAKSASEAVVLWANGPSLATAVLCLPAMYGPRENEKTGIAISFIRVANTFATRIQLGSNNVVHEWIYVENAAIAHLLAVKALFDPQQRAGGEAYFVTDGAPIKLWDFVRRLWTAAGDGECNSIGKIIIPWWVMLVLAVTTEVAFRVFTLGRILPPLSRQHIHYMKEGAWFDTEKARERLGYEPLVSTDEGIRRTVDWYTRRSSAASVQKIQ